MVKSTNTDTDNKKKNNENKDKESASNSVTILIIEKNGTMKNLSIKNYDEEELFKKCGFKKKEGFEKKTTYNVKLDGKKYSVQVFAKEDGKSNFENKYDFPPPIDNKLFFGSCALIASMAKDNGSLEHIPLTIPLWEKLYEKLFGGFEDLTKIEDDDNEEDELDKIPTSKKTKKGGYLKDGFVVDDSEDNEDEDADTETIYETEDEDEDELETSQEKEEDLNLDDIGSELSEEEYLTSDDESD